MQCSSMLSKPDFPTLSGSERCLGLHEDFHTHSNAHFCRRSILFHFLFLFFCLSRRKIINIPWTPHIMLIKFLSSSRWVYQGQRLPCEVGCCSSRGDGQNSLFLDLNKLPGATGITLDLLMRSICKDWALLLRIMENFSVIKLKARIHISPSNFIVMQGDWSFLAAFFSSSLLSSKGLEMTGPVWISENRNMPVFRALVVALNF